MTSKNSAWPIHHPRGPHPPLALPGMGCWVGGRGKKGKEKVEQTWPGAGGRGSCWPGVGDLRGRGWNLRGVRPRFQAWAPEAWGGWEEDQPGMPGLGFSSGSIFSLLWSLGKLAALSGRQSLLFQTAGRFPQSSPSRCVSGAAPPPPP